MLRFAKNAVPAVGPTEEESMHVLGVTSDDKGAQLEKLVRSILERQGYKKVRLNVVGAGGNELDIKAVLEAVLLRETQVTQVLGEAKAYTSPINMPTWQKFLGKVFIERSSNPTAIGMLVALNGINGNVAGSYEALRDRDKSLFIFEGTDLAQLATHAAEIGDPEVVVKIISGRFHRLPIGLEVAYYENAFYWIARWKGDQYSIVDGQGRMLSAHEVEQLRPACEASLAGSLLATDEARVAAEARHNARLSVVAALLRGEEDLRLDGDHDKDMAEVVPGLAEEPFCKVEDGRLMLLEPEQLDARAVKRLFLSLFEDTVRVAQLARFMVERLHEPYVARLVDLIPDLQAGFHLNEAEAASLRSIAVVFPSVWVTIASENPMLVNHRGDGGEVTPAISDSERASFWESIIAAVRSDFSNQRLHGFLYDYMGVAEIESSETFIVKSKDGPIGEPISIRYRNAVRQFDATAVGQEGPMYVPVRLLPTANEPWDEEHPAPDFPLDDD